MFDQARQLGVDAALDALGLAKTAWFNPQAVLNPLKAINWRGGLNTLKTNLVGNPGQVWNEFKSGKFFHPEHGSFMQSLKPQSAMGALMNYGMPAYNIYSAAMAPPEQQGSSLGEAVGSAAGSLLGGPLGMVGSTVGGAALGSLGRSVGSAFDKSSPPTPYHAPLHRYPQAAHMASPTPSNTPPLSQQMSQVTGRPV